MHAWGHNGHIRLGVDKEHCKLGCSVKIFLKGKRKNKISACQTRCTTLHSYTNGCYYIMWGMIFNQCGAVGPTYLQWLSLLALLVLFKLTKCIFSK